MERGDIIWVNFGINVGDEFSDIGTDGHFAIYWSQNGFQIIVIPISAEERQPEKKFFRCEFRTNSWLTVRQRFIC